MEIGSPHFWVASLEIIVINILLSGDNAVVIALACRNLPAGQRRWGIFWGAIGAIVLRIILTFFAVSLLKLPWLKIVGGIALVWIGIKLIAQEEEGDGVEVKASDRLLAAVWTVIVADIVMSIDNVLGVAAAAKGSLPLLVFGLVVSIPLIIAGAQLVMKAIERYPVLIVAGGGLLGFIAGELVIDDTSIGPWIDARAPWLDWVAPLVGIALVVGPAKWLEARRHRAA
ncbi:MAG TPA: TerC family protein [Casimicrobiaceae bacterium]|nr:TerC family protein [Casimicrobiaceae bacterium]